MMVKATWKGRLARVGGSLLSVGAGLVATQAHAELPAAIGTTLTDIQADALSVIALGWPVFGAIVGGFVLFKIAKRVVSKSTG